MDMVSIFLDRLDATVGLVNNVKADQLNDATPCHDFDVRALLNHIIAGQYGLAMALTGSHVDPKATLPDLVGQAGDNPAEAMKGAAEAARTAWTAEGALDQENIPVGDGMPANGALRIALLEVVVHGWDLAKATNQTFELPDMLAVQMLAGLKMQFGEAPREPGGFFGPQVEVPDSATPIEKLVAFTGRTP